MEASRITPTLQSQIFVISHFLFLLAAKSIPEYITGWMLVQRTNGLLLLFVHQLLASFTVHKTSILSSKGWFFLSWSLATCVLAKHQKFFSAAEARTQHRTANQLQMLHGNAEVDAPAVITEGRKFSKGKWLSPISLQLSIWYKYLPLGSALALEKPLQLTHKQ